MEDFLNNFDGKTKLLCFATTSVTLLITVLVGVSFTAVEPTEYGLQYNIVTKKIIESPEEILTGGL